MSIWRALGAIITATTLTALTSCSAGVAAAPAAATSEPVKVVAAFYPFQFVAERVGGDQVSVVSLTQPGVEPHDLELTAQQVASLSSADLVAYQAGFQAAVDTAIAQAAPQRVVDATSFLTLKTLAEESGHSAEEGEDAHAGGTDPHTWQDPTNMVAIAEHVRDALIEARPAAAAAFTANTAALVADLNQLDGEFRTGLSACAIKPFVTSHAAFGYIAGRYGLEQVAIRGLEPDTEPTAARIAAVQEIARDNKVTTIFFETLVSPVVSESIAQDLGLRTDVLDPIEGITSASKGSDYLAVMRSNLAALRAANQCS